MNARAEPRAVVTSPEAPPIGPADDWTARNQRWLIGRFAALRERLERLERPSADAPDPEASPPAQDLVHADFVPALQRCAELFGLSPFERDLLLLAAGVELDTALRQAVAATFARSGRPSFGLALALLDGAHWDALSTDAPLRYWRLIELERGMPLAGAALRIDERVLHFITGLAADDDRLLGIANRLRAPLQAEADDPLADRIALALFDHAGRPAAVVLAASNDAARTAALDSTGSALARCGLQSLLIDARDLPTEPRERVDIARTLDREAALSGAALVVCLDGGHAHAGGGATPLASLLAQLRSPLLLVGTVGAEWLAQLQARRRVVRLAAAAPQARVPDAVAWSGAVNRATQQFRISPAMLQQALDDFDAAREPVTDAALWRALREAARGGLDDLAERIDSQTSFADLVLPRAQLAQLADITRQLRHRSLVFEQWGFGAKSQRGLGLAVLFVGESGTGKTMAAEAIANETRLDLYRIDLASVVSKYIGETEKNLERLFDAAESSGAVLLFDEADALFGKRSEVKDSHDRYANIEVAYLLQRIESYRGLAILTSNMKSALDRAFLRRIRFVVQFPFPDEAARAELWRRQFPAAAPCGEIDVAALARLSLAGGNIRSIAVNAAFIAADRGGAIEHGMVIDAARAEFAKLERVFADRGGSSP